MTVLSRMEQCVPSKAANLLARCNYHRAGGGGEKWGQMRNYE